MPKPAEVLNEICRIATSRSKIKRIVLLFLERIVIIKATILGVIMLLEKLFGSRVRAELIKTLFSKKGNEVYLREFSRMTGFSASCILREVKSLAEEALVAIDRRENRVYCRANEKSPVYQALLDLVEKTSSGEAILKRVFADCNAKCVFIYGSRASGRARPDSDYDVFVIGDEGLRRVSARVNEAAHEIGVEINPYVISETEFIRRFREKDNFLSDVMKSRKIFLKGGEHELGSMES